MRLYINVDHVATVRQARRTYEPDPVEAAAACERAGADGITVHLREDRRHIQDDDVRRLAQSVTTVLNFELATAELDESARRSVIGALGPQARAIHRRHRPLRLEPGQFAGQARAGKGYLVEGRVRKFDDVTVTGMIFMPMTFFWCTSGTFI